MPSYLQIGSSVLASSLRLWNGTWGKLPAKTPERLLELFDREDDAQCRLVREVLTELNLDAIIYPCPTSGQRFLRRRMQMQSKAACRQDLPILHDPNTGKSLGGADAIIQYLFAHYLGQDIHSRLRPSMLQKASAGLAGLVRNAGTPIRAEASLEPRKKLVLYSFESSPFARLVRERLCALELPYHLINVGKMRWGEMGPAVRRLAPGPYQPIAGSKRALFLETHGKVQVPFLIDPNTSSKLFESADIIRYLEQHYAKPRKK